MATKSFDPDFGLKPEGLKAPAGVMRLQVSLPIIVLQYCMTTVMAGIGIGFAVLFIWVRPCGNLGDFVFGLGLLACFCFLTYRSGIRGCWFWVELDGDIIRKRDLYSFRVTEYRIEDIKEVWTLACARGQVVTGAIDYLLGRVRGFEIRFGRPWRAVRVLLEFRNGLEFCEAVVARMNERGKVVPEIIDMDGQPFIRKLYWEHRR